MLPEADDQVVMHGDLERSSRFDDLIGHVNIGAGGRWVTAWVIVHQDNRRGPELERALDHFAGIDRRVIDGAFLLNFIGDEVVLFIQE